MNSELEDLQTRFSYQELEIHALNAKVAEQQQEIDGLKRQMREMLGLLKDLRPGLPLDGDEPPPPHY
jgi:uncharacterized coiled-coil protein SlyX